MATLQAVFRTGARKFSKSVAQRGLAQTVQRCLVIPLQYARAMVWNLGPATRRRRREDRHFDRTFGVDTCVDSDWGWLADITSPNWEHGNGYWPAQVRSLPERLIQLPIRYEDFGFIDLGSGKGRALLLASEFPFKEIIGVEYAPKLHQIATRNIARYRSATQQCRNIRSVCEDATTFTIPAQPLVVYLYEPFDKPIMRQVVARIEQSLAHTPRPVFILYFNPTCAELFEDRGYFTRIGHGEQFFDVWHRTQQGEHVTRWGDDLDDERYAIYEALQLNPA